jgi:hypothetical protein
VFKIVLLLSIVFLSFFSFLMPAYAQLELVGAEGVLMSREQPDLQVYMDGMLRLSYNSLGHVVTLDWNRKTDVQDYMGYQYSAGLGATYKEDYKGYIRFASYGPTEYDAPLFPYGQVHTIWGDVGEYWGKKLLPRLDEWWIDVPVGPIKTKTGLFTYSVGTGLALGGYYEKYGISIYQELDNLTWTFHFDVPDIDHKWYLGPKLIAEKEPFGITYNSKAYFFAGDILFNIGDHSFQPYIGLLADMTPASRRTSVYVPAIDQDYLGTYGAYLQMIFGDLTLEFESAANFGEAHSSDARFNSIAHQGYFFFTGASYSMLEETVVPRAKFYWVSGNKFTGDDIGSQQLVHSSNREFSVYSPTNSNLADSHYTAFEGGPYVFMGMGYNLNNGILRPNTFYDPYQMTNIIAPNIGVDMMLSDKLFLSLDYWYLHAQQPPIGADYDPVNDVYSPYTLSSNLGNELDLYAEYYVNDYITFSFLGGIFFPGAYFHTRRGDQDLLGVAAAPRFDGGASNAWVIEAAVTYSY